MTKLDDYVLTNFLIEMNKLNYDYKLLETYSIWKFRYVCYKFNYFMSHITLPKIKQKNFYEAVFIEFRILPNIEFIIRNAILKLGSEWSFTIVCGLNNYDYINSIVNKIGTNIRIISLDYENLEQDEYSKLLMTEYFWNLFYGEKILVYQEDSLIFHNDIKPFIKFDFIGAPFLKTTNDTPNCVGNGGISLRTKNTMLDIIKKYNYKNLILNTSTLSYMKINNLTNPPEDVYFSKNMQENKIGEVADWDTAYEFSSEQLFNPNSFAGHKFWISNDKWESFLKKIYFYNKYTPKSDINKYLVFKNLPQDFNKTKLIKNAFDIDLEFFCNVNNIEYISDINTLEYINKIGLDGFIYHPKQLYNIFGEDIKFYNFLNNFYVFYNNKIYIIQDFINKYIYNNNFDQISELLIQCKYDILNDNYDTILLVFLGNDDIAYNLLDKIVKYKQINKEFNLSFCINKNSIKDMEKLKNIIKNNFDFYAIYYSKEFGTDITPTLLMYNNIIKKHNIKNIIKLHTKSVKKIYDKLTNYLLGSPIDSIINDKQFDCNCIGPRGSYIYMSKDVYNNALKSKYSNQLNMYHSFVEGTMFFCDNVVFFNTLEFMKKNNYRSYLLNNLYENNSINQQFSPIHFLERVFGSIKL